MWRLNVIPGLADLAAGRLVDALITALLVPAAYILCWPVGLVFHAVSLQHAREEG